MGGVTLRRYESDNLNFIYGDIQGDAKGQVPKKSSFFFNSIYRCLIDGDTKNNFQIAVIQ